MLGACRIVEGDALGESVYYGIACRMAQLIDLPYKACVTRLERETNIRGRCRTCLGRELADEGQYGTRCA
jgi:hypothetical protein